MLHSLQETKREALLLLLLLQPTQTKFKQQKPQIRRVKLNFPYTKNSNADWYIWRNRSTITGFNWCIDFFADFTCRTYATETRTIR